MAATAAGMTKEEVEAVQKLWKLVMKDAKTISQNYLIQYAIHLREREISCTNLPN